MNEILYEIVTQPEVRDGDKLETVIRQKLSVGGPWYD